MPVYGCVCKVRHKIEVTGVRLEADDEGLERSLATLGLDQLPTVGTSTGSSFPAFTSTPTNTTCDSDMAASQDTAAQTLSMLEERLQYVDYLVNGDGKTAEAQRRASRATPTSTGSATARLRNLERALKALAAKSYAVADLLQLHKQHPDLFHPTDAQTLPSTLPPAALAQLILAHEQLYKSSATQLTTLNENNAIPDPAVMAKLVALQPRIDKAAAKQKEQLHEFHELRVRSMRIVEGWCEKGVLEMGGNWADWEEKLRECEILVRRHEAAKRREDEFQ